MNTMQAGRALASLDGSRPPSVHCWPLRCAKIDQDWQPGALWLPCNGVV